MKQELLLSCQNVHRQRPNSFSASKRNGWMLKTEKKAGTFLRVVCPFVSEVKIGHWRRNGWTLSWGILWSPTVIASGTLPSGATSPDECRDAFIHGQSPWPSAAGVKFVRPSCRTRSGIQTSSRPRIKYGVNSSREPSRRLDPSFHREPWIPAGVYPDGNRGRNDTRLSKL